MRAYAIAFLATLLGSTGVCTPLFAQLASQASVPTIFLEVRGLSVGYNVATSIEDKIIRSRTVTHSTSETLSSNWIRTDSNELKWTTSSGSDDENTRSTSLSGSAGLSAGSSSQDKTGGSGSLGGSFTNFQKGRLFSSNGFSSTTTTSLADKRSKTSEQIVQDVDLARSDSQITQQIDANAGFVKVNLNVHNLTNAAIKLSNIRGEIWLRSKSGQSELVASGQLTDQLLSTSAIPAVHQQQQQTTSIMTMDIPAQQTGGGVASRVVYIPGISADLIRDILSSDASVEFKITEYTADWNEKHFSWSQLVAGWAADKSSSARVFLLDQDGHVRLYMFAGGARLKPSALMQETKAEGAPFRYGCDETGCAKTRDSISQQGKQLRLDEAVFHLLDRFPFLYDLSRSGWTLAESGISPWKDGEKGNLLNADEIALQSAHDYELVFNRSAAVADTIQLRQDTPAITFDYGSIKNLGGANSLDRDIYKDFLPEPPSDWRSDAAKSYWRERGKYHVQLSRVAPDDPSHDRSKFCVLTFHDAKWDLVPENAQLLVQTKILSADYKVTDESGRDSFLAFARGAERILGFFEPRQVHTDQLGPKWVSPAEISKLFRFVSANSPTDETELTAVDKEGFSIGNAIAVARYKVSHATYNVCVNLNYETSPFINKRYYKKIAEPAAGSDFENIVQAWIKAYGQGVDDGTIVRPLQGVMRVAVEYSLRDLLQSMAQAH